MNELQIFNNPDFGEIRTVEKDGEAWIVAADVCRVLEIGNPTDALSRLDDDERTLVSIEGASNGKPVNAVNEAGMYALVLGSRKKEAKAFKRWVTHEVLPSIRKTGEYKAPKASRKPSLGEINSAARIINGIYKEAGMAPQYRAAAMQNLYALASVALPLEGMTVDKRSFDCTTIAKRLGVFSKAGQPHGQAIGAIIREIGVAESEVVMVPFQRANNGHSGPTAQYTESVVERVAEWLRIADYPQRAMLDGKTYKIVYSGRQKETA